MNHQDSIKTLQRGKNLHLPILSTLKVVLNTFYLEGNIKSQCLLGYSLYGSFLIAKNIFAIPYKFHVHNCFRKFFNYSYL